MTQIDKLCTMIGDVFRVIAKDSAEVENAHNSLQARVEKLERHAFGVFAQNIQKEKEPLLICMGVQKCGRIYCPHSKPHPQEDECFCPCLKDFGVKISVCTPFVKEKDCCKEVRKFKGEPFYCSPTPLRRSVIILTRCPECGEEL